MDYKESDVRNYNEHVACAGEKFKVTPLSKILVETTNHCDIDRCTFCSHKNMKRKREHMDINVYKKTVNQAVRLGFKTIDLRYYGEPMLDEGLEQKITYAKQRRFETVMINTNGLKLTKKRFESLVQAGLNVVAFSLSPKREYEATRGVSFDIPYSNLEEISTSEYKDVLQVWTVVTKNTTKEELEEYDKLIRQLGLKVNYTKEVCKNEDLVAGNVEQKEQSNIYCSLFLNCLLVLADGSVPLCPMFHDSGESLGNLKEDNLEDILNSEKYLTFREQHLGFDFADICKRCSEPEESFCESFIKYDQILPLEYFLSDAQK